MKLFFTFLFSLIFINAKAQRNDIYLNFDDSNFLYKYSTWSTDTDSICCLSNWITIDTVSYPHNTWQIGHPYKTTFTSARSNPNAIVTDTVHSCTPNDTSVFILNIPYFFDGYIVGISFWYQLNIDTTDIAIIEISADTGKTWKNILDTSTYSFYFANGKPDLSKSTIGWDSISIHGTYYYDGELFPSPPDSAFLRFTFITDSAISKRDGWILDDFIFTYWPPEEVTNINKTINCNIFPNPAKDNLHLKYSLTTQANLSITLTNVLGQTVKTKYIHIPYPALPISLLAIYPMGFTFIQ